MKRQDKEPGILLLLYHLCISCIMCAQSIGDIDDLCSTVEVLRLKVGVRTEITPSSTNQCWRVVGESPRDDRVIRATLLDVTPQTLNITDDFHTCTPRHQNQQGLLLYDGADPNTDLTIVEHCTFQNTTVSSRRTVFSTQPSMFIKWSEPTSGSIILQLVKLRDADRICRTLRRRAGESFFTIKSTHYPNHYPRDNFHCWTHYNSEPDTMYEIHIQHIELGNHRGARGVHECADKVRIHTWDSREASRVELLHTFCENERSRYLYVTRPHILISFITNSVRQAAGFWFDIRVIQLSQSPPHCTPVAMSSSSAVEITSPGYPQQYINNVDMCWDFGFAEPEAHEDYTLAVQVRAQELDPTWLDECPMSNSTSDQVDRIDITSGPGIEGTVITSQCGTFTQSPDSSGAVLMRTSGAFNVRFRSDGFFRERGFSYVIVPETKTCTEVFIKRGDHALQLNHSEVERKGQSEVCWKVRTGDERSLAVTSLHSTGNQALVVHVHSVTLDTNGDCINNYLRLYQGTSAAGTLLREFCPGDNTTGQLDVHSLSNEINIRFKSSVSSRDFKMTVQALPDWRAEDLSQSQQRDNECERNSALSPHREFPKLLLLLLCVRLWQ